MSRLTENQRLNRAVGVGMVIAAGMVAGHCDVTAEEILQAAGVTSRREARKIGVDAYDIKLLRRVFNRLEGEQRRTQPTTEGARP